MREAGPLTADSDLLAILDEKHTQYAPWLKREAVAKIPRSITGNLDARVVDYYFSRWIIQPCNHRLSPGHLQDLPVLYEQSLPGTALRLSIEACGYGEFRGQQLKARSKYGAALGRIRELIFDINQSTRDSVLAALLIIDNFEVC